MPWTGRFKEQCGTCQGDVEYTDQMVLDNLIRGLTDEEIKKKVLAMLEESCTLKSVRKFVQAEEIGKFSLSDLKVFGSVAAVSGYKMQQKVEHGQFDRGLKVCSSRRGKHKTRKEHCKAWRRLPMGLREIASNVVELAMYKLTARSERWSTQ